MNKFEQVSSLGHQMSELVGGRAGGSRYRRGGRTGGPCMVKSNASWLMVT